MSRIVSMDDMNTPSSSGAPPSLERLAAPNTNAWVPRYSTAQRTGPCPPSRGEPERVMTA
jgi:hypothetical protein